MYKYSVIFDMDGVLFDSERAYIDAYRTVLARDGIQIIEGACLDSIGVNLDRAREICRSYYGDDFDYDYYRAKVRGELSPLDIPVKPYAYELLTGLKKCGVPTALASSTSSSGVSRMLSARDMLKYFDVIVCGDMVRHSKPHPEIFLTVAERLDAKPGECFVIEDSYNGIRAAHNAGMRPLMVPDILQPDSEIQGLAEAILPDLEGVWKYLSNDL